MERLIKQISDSLEVNDFTAEMLSEGSLALIIGTMEGRLIALTTNAKLINAMALATF